MRLSNNWQPVTLHAGKAENYTAVQCENQRITGNKRKNNLRIPGLMQILFTCSVYATTVMTLCRQDGNRSRA